ncbi:MAG TPA: hypothetical protein VIU11_22935 [Nakamurella sp.]
MAIFNGDGVDRLDPVSHEVSRFASFGFNDATDLVAAAPNGDVFVANHEGDVFKVDGDR